MVQSELPSAAPLTSSEEIQKEWHELRLRVEKLEAQRTTLEQENKSLRELLERSIEHRQKSHTELVLLLTGLVSKLPMNDVGVIVSRLVEHNTNVSQYLAALTKGSVDGLPALQPTVLKTLEETKRELSAALKPVIEELMQLDTPLEKDLLAKLVAHPDSFFSPSASRGNRCFIKGLVARERIVREFGEEALPLFNDVTTDAKLNPHPKPEEIVLCFRNDFESLLEQNTKLAPAKHEALAALFKQIQRSKAPTEQARQQKIAFLKASFLIELLHFYENQATEAPDVMFAQRLPAVLEQLSAVGSPHKLDEKLVEMVEHLIGFVISSDHRHMIVNNLGKTGGQAKTLKYILKLRAEKVLEPDVVGPEFVKHLLPSGQKPPVPAAIAEILRLVNPAMQKLVIRYILASDRLRKNDAEALAKGIGEALGLHNLAEEAKAALAVPPEIEQRLAWEKVKDMIARRTDATAVAAAMRDRLNAKYDADEIRQSWLALTEADPISLIRIFCHLPYRADGKTDPIARPVIEIYVTRLLHEKYAATYKKIVTSLRNMFTAKPDSPTLLNFLALVRWVDPGAANKISADIGMHVAA
ncbi:MAG TPA: hypothetical protein VFE51_11475 [Verrucomicrobiae bacterium]|nr:hypothetical protein [Verrucomicrobiae bacterium]